MSSSYVSPAIDFSRRAHLSEWMDEPCSYGDFRDCLRDLERVNRLILGYGPTLGWIERFVGGDDPLHILDVGCGGGDMLRRVEAWAQTRKIPVRLTGIDRNPHAARAAREFSGGASRIEWITGDALDFEPSEAVHIVISSLLTHHLTDSEIVRFLQWMERTAARGWFISDLHRKAIPYYLFGALATLMRPHRFIRHDGLISIRRSFDHDDWENYCALAGLNVKDVNIYAVRPARLCVGRVKK
ncbi:MAG TPA: methyltransferase domain-containing protein [Acidobacteriaceae bacterium]|nr:methyltransferase domain-containing protein [Acidobacteriaceae bacterium]